MNKSRYYRYPKAGLLLLLVLTLQQFAYAEGNTELRAKVLASNCTTCHGPNGIGSRKIPKLKGLNHQDIMESMRGFQNGEEKSTIMSRHAKGYSREELKLLADYFATQSR